MSKSATVLSPQLRELTERHKTTLRQSAEASVLHVADTVCTSDDVIQRLEEMFGDDDVDGPLLADGFEDALVGYVEGYVSQLVALYDNDKCIQILVERDGMEWQGAREYFDINVMGSGMGEGYPAFATIMRHA